EGSANALHLVGRSEALVGRKSTRKPLAKINVRVWVHSHVFLVGKTAGLCTAAPAGPRWGWHPGGCASGMCHATAFSWHAAHELHRMGPRHRGRNDRSEDTRMTWQLDATALSTLLDARDITPLQLLQQSLARLDATEPVLNAFTHVDRDG